MEYAQKRLDTVRHCQRRDLSPSILDEGLKSSRSPLHALCRNSKYELSRQFISCVVPFQNHISPTTIPPIGTGRTIRLFIPRNQCPTLQFRYCFCSCMELSFLQFAVGFVVNFKHSATIPRWKGDFSPVISCFCGKAMKRNRVDAEGSPSPFAISPRFPQVFRSYRPSLPTVPIDPRIPRRPAEA